MTAALGVNVSAFGEAPPTDVALSGARWVRLVARLKQDIAGKGIMFFMAVDQAKLGADAGIALPPSTLLIFGNPPLGIQFLTANANAGLDWPVRMLVTQDDDGAVWVSWTDFRFVAGRYQLQDRDAQIKMASEVAASIASAARKQP